MVIHYECNATYTFRCDKITPGKLSLILEAARDKIQEDITKCLGSNNVTLTTVVDREED